MQQTHSEKTKSSRRTIAQQQSDAYSVTWGSYAKYKRNANKWCFCQKASRRCRLRLCSCRHQQRSLQCRQKAWKKRRPKKNLVQINSFIWCSQMSVYKKFDHLWKYGHFRKINKKWWIKRIDMINTDENPNRRSASFLSHGLPNFLGASVL